MTKVISIFFAIFAITNYKIYDLFNKEQPKPYMDEIFHIPQAQKFCNGSFNDVYTCFNINICFKIII